MPDYTSSVEVGAAPDALFSYLSDVRNLPRYVPRIVAVRPLGDQAVAVTVRLADGSVLEDEAWCRLDGDAQRLEWGSAGPNEYRGWLTVEAVEGHLARVTVGIHTHDTAVGNGLDETVAGIREQFESSGA